ncbi:MAG: YbhB/YbcL family Raf kinase inhibitor-like protein [Methanomicrobiaceae archaeon]|nr:YbhB/YbcL family Raf kinase inhibitor-like protein [Methanomicrobiaceae archaeon]
MKPRTGLLLLLLAAACIAACTGVENAPPSMPQNVEVASPAFASGESIPPLYTCDGDDISPPLTWTGVPPGTMSLALVMDDPDAPGGAFTHWLAWNISPGIGGLPEGEAVAEMGIVQGTNGFGAPGYAGPCPPGGEHRYRFRVLALDTVPGISPDAGRGEFDRAAEGHIIGWGELQATYGRA